MPRALIFYHYFYPDDVASATHFSDLATGLANRGWDVTAMPCNRGCRDESRTYFAAEEWRGVRIRRVWRPQLRQASSIGRVLNAAWMIARWSMAALTLRPAPDVVVVGTDPILSVLVARFWKFFRPETRIVHWCFDLYPEAAVADGFLKPGGLVHRIVNRLVRPAYRCCDLVADIGSCMRHRLSAWVQPSKSITLTPWALAEPARPLQSDPAERAGLFGNARLALMYSGTLGRAHVYEDVLALARLLRERDIKLVFSVRGNCAEKLEEAVSESDSNISFCPFASAASLERRLSAADVHIVTLHPDWTGLVVPSKFFGAIAAGRPVLFAGSRESAIAQWIERYQLGWVLTADNLQAVAREITAYMNQPLERARMQQHCHQVYRRHFSKDHVLDAFDHRLRELLDIGEAVPVVDLKEVGRI
ncbi:MAG TPA: glycosyltransferase family 4 protein [Candidatus Angelobacter sp.]|nr:glycosyltransferase family 4 protein [Candidatus Angelobacter sp.]